MLFNVTRWVVGVVPTSSSVQLMINMMNYTNDTPNTHTRLIDEDVLYLMVASRGLI